MSKQLCCLLPSKLQKLKHLCFRDMNIRQADAAAMPDQPARPARHGAASSLAHALIRSRRRTPSLLSRARSGFRVEPRLSLAMRGACRPVSSLRASPSRVFSRRSPASRSKRFQEQNDGGSRRRRTRGATLLSRPQGHQSCRRHAGTDGMASV